MKDWGKREKCHINNEIFVALHYTYIAESYLKGAFPWLFADSILLDISKALSFCVYMHKRLRQFPVTIRQFFVCYTKLNKKRVNARKSWVEPRICVQAIKRFFLGTNWNRSGKKVILMQPDSKFHTLGQLYSVNGPCEKVGYIQWEGEKRLSDVNHLV